MAEDIVPQALSVASLAALAARGSGSAFVLLEVDLDPDRGSPDLAAAFAALGDEAVDVLEGGQLVLRYPSDEAAQTGFNAVTAIAEAAYAADDAVTAVVTYVGVVVDRIMTTSNMSGPTGFANRHVFRDGALVNEDRFATATPHPDATA